MNTPADNTLDTLLDRRKRFLAFVTRRVDDPALAEDILQAAYVRALEGTQSLRGQESAVAWFYTVLRNAVIDHFRRRRSESSALERWTRELTTEMQHAGHTRDMVCRCIEAVLPSLRPGYAELLREVDLAEEPLSRFAERHQLTPGNAAVRAHRARAALRRELIKTCGARALQECANCTCSAGTEVRRPDL